MIPETNRLGIASNYPTFPSVMVQRKMTLLGVESTIVLEESIFQLHDYSRSIVEQFIPLKEGLVHT